jgi:hypothetical protein
MSPLLFAQYINTLESKARIPLQLHPMPLSSDSKVIRFKSVWPITEPVTDIHFAEPALELDGGLVSVSRYALVLSKHIISEIFNSPA